ncbi:hypothetical protein J6590_096430 [Homalodisca vitripennis]|nr:hypothetical protein J6590_096430 [Homalodisca vitripennis]
MPPANARVHADSAVYQGVCAHHLFISAASVLTQALVYYTGGVVPRVSAPSLPTSISDIYNMS